MGAITLDGKPLDEFDRLVNSLQAEPTFRALLNPLFDSIGVHSALFRRKQAARRDAQHARWQGVAGAPPRLLLNDFVFLRDEARRDAAGDVYVHNFATDRTLRTSQRGAQLLRSCRNGVSLDDLLAQMPDSRDKVESYLESMVSAGVLVVPTHQTT